MEQTKKEETKAEVPETAAEKAARIEQEEDEYFDQMLTAFQASDAAKNYDADEDVEYFTNHPLMVKEITPEMIDNNPDLQAM